MEKDFLNSTKNEPISNPQTQPPSPPSGTEPNFTAEKSMKNAAFSSIFESDFEPAQNSHQNRSSQRMIYEAQVEVIKKSLGNFEDIRLKLGLSRRKMAQLLLVDPSSWTRWSQSDAPPYIYRALEWYLLLQNKHPSLTNGFWINSLSSSAISKSNTELEELSALKKGFAENANNLEKEIQSKILQIKKEVKFYVLVSFILGSLVGSLFIAFI